MRQIVLAMVAALFLTGCTGIISGYDYDVTKVYKVVKGGVQTLMTEDEIREAGLDKAGEGVEYAYSVIKEDAGNETAPLRSHKRK